jgi:hypothetical protein
VLQHALANGNTKVTLEIIDWLKDVLKTKPEDLRKLLTNVTKDGFTVLQHAIATGDAKIALEIIDWLKKALDNRDIKEILRKHNKQYYNLLHSAGLTHNSSLFFAVIDLFKDTFKEDYKKEISILANETNKSGYKPTSKNNIEIRNFLCGFQNFKNREDNHKRKNTHLDTQKEPDKENTHSDKKRRIKCI